MRALGQTSIVDRFGAPAFPAAASEIGLCSSPTHFRIATPSAVDEGAGPLGTSPQKSVIDEPGSSGKCVPVRKSYTACSPSFGGGEASARGGNCL